MRFYKQKTNTNYYSFIFKNKLNAIYQGFGFVIIFYKNGKEHNNKNASFIDGSHKEFSLNGNYYGSHYKFTKESWRKFIRELKLQAFL